MRRGIILPVILVLISVLVLLALTRHFFSRQQLHFAGMISEKEQAYYASNGMRKIAIGLLEKTFDFYNSGADETFPKLEKATKPVKYILEKLLDENGEPSFKKMSFKLDSETMGDYVNKLKQSGIELDDYSVELLILPVSPLFKPSPSGRGIMVDENELSWKLILRCFSRIGNGQETVVWYREGRTVSLQPPVIGKFSLFLLEPDSEKINGLTLGVKASPGALPPLPVQILNGQTCSRESKKPLEARDFIDSQGWVYFGESKVHSFRLNSEAGLVNPGYFETAMESSESLSKKGAFSYYYYCDTFREELKRSADGIAPFAEVPDKVFFQTSSIVPNGSSSNPSPTLIIGRVLRSYPIVQGLSGEKSGLAFDFPMLGSAQFSGSSWPCKLSSGEIQMIKDNFDNSFSKYSQRMSFIYQEPYNAANLQVIDLGNAHQEFAVLQPDSLPATVPKPPVSKKIKANGNFAEFVGTVSGSSYSLFDDSGKEIFSGAPLASVANYSFVKKKAARSFTNFKMLEKACKRKKSGAIILPGAVNVKSDLVLAKPIQFSDVGGLIICEGNIFISAPIKTENDVPLCFISLNGNITVSGGISVDAGLIALKGDVKLGRDATIRGLVAARFFKFDLSGGRAAKIIYNNAFDTTSVQARKRSYRFCLDEKEYYLVE